MADIRVRRAADGDQAALRALRIGALTESPDAFGSTLDRELARTDADWQRWFAPGSVAFIATGAGADVGLVAGAHDSADPAVVQLMAMWVDPERRGSGAADALVAALLAWAAAEGAREVRLQVVENNQRARSFYQRQGFRPTGRGTTRPRDGAPEIEMARSGNREPVVSV